MGFFGAILQMLSTHWIFYFTYLIENLNESCEAPGIRFSPPRAWEVVITSFGATSQA